MSNVFSSLENDATEKVDGENFNMNEKIVETHRSEKNKPGDLSDFKALLSEYWKFPD